jgi:MYXO-CTERM domain-containing protein
MKNFKIAGIAMIAVAGAANAAITGVSVTPDNISSLELSYENADGVFNGGEGTRTDLAPFGADWGFVSAGNRQWVDESWVAGGNVQLSSSGQSGLESVDQEIFLNKRTRNRSGFVWTGFEIVLTNAGGAITLLSTPSNSNFSTVNVAGDGTNTVTITYSGGSVALNSFTTFQVDFTIPSGPSWQYTQIQTPVPTPGALALLGLGGLAAGRRRR